MRRYLLPLALVLSLSACAQIRAQMAAREAAQAPAAPLLRAPADWGELAHQVALRASQRASQVSELGRKPIFVAEPGRPTPFARALNQYLRTSLAELGLAVAQKRDDGVVVLEADVQSVRMAEGLQVVVTTSIGNGSRYLFRDTEAYAVNQADVPLYDESLLPAPPAPPVPVKRMNVTGGA